MKTLRLGIIGVGSFVVKRHIPEILKIKNQSLFKRFLSNILAIFNPKEIPKKKAEPISRNEFIGAIAVVIAFIMLILYIIVEWDSIYSFFNN